MANPSEVCDSAESGDRLLGKAELKGHVMHRFLRLALVVGVLAAALAPLSVLAEKPANPECWGVVTSQRATSERDIGEHASEEEVPRLGLGNLARLLYEAEVTEGPHISDLGSTLAEIDEIDATQCP